MKFGYNCGCWKPLGPGEFNFAKTESKCKSPWAWDFLETRLEPLIAEQDKRTLAASVLPRLANTPPLGTQRPAIHGAQAGKAAIEQRN